MKKRNTLIIPLISVIVIAVFIVGYWLRNETFPALIPSTNPQFTLGQEVDSFKGVRVFYNGSVGNVTGRNTTEDGYNLGLKYQCVEFVKRYYYKALNHKMPDSYGHAKDFFDINIKDTEHNSKRNLTQFTNPSKSKPQVNDLVVYSATMFNQYGHVAIVTKVNDDAIQIIQQNPGPYGNSRVHFSIANDNGLWNIDNENIIGWLRKEN